MKRSELVTYLDDYLHIHDIVDYGPQGLQLESDNDDIRKVALAVDVAPGIIRTAVAWGADMLLVHHGILWRDVARIAGPLGERVRLMLQHGLNLYAAHLALDAHPEVGNNAVLARMFNVTVEDWWCAPTGTPIAVVGPVVEPLPLSDLQASVSRQLQTNARSLGNGPETVRTMAILSGFGADKVGEAQTLGADTFLTGETSHQNFWAASDYNMNVIFGGHYATETVGVQALGRHLAQRFDLDVKFFDFPTEM